MRLQLTVGRQGMVPVHLLWDPIALRPNRTEDGANITIAQLLDQINEVVPLEATDWGLEDYVVEVNGFECLHFCSLSILKENDHVVVRPLQTSDLRFRRVSGRHQISWDGKHLIDGVAFGRPFLRRADRPPIKIPPRKRIRLTYDADEETANPTEPYNSQQALVRSNSNDADNEESDDNIDDGDYGFSEGEDLDLANELQDLNKESEDFDRGLQNSKRTVISHGATDYASIVPKPRKKRREEGLGIYEKARLDVLDRSDAQYVGEYHNPLLDQYYKDEPVSPRRQSAKQNASSKLRGGGTVLKGKASKSIPASRRSSSASLKSVRFEGEEFETPATVRQASDSEAEDDEDFEDDLGVATDSTESNKENVQPGKNTRRLKIVHKRKDESSTDLDTSSVSSDTDSESSYTSSSWDSSSSDSGTSHRETESGHQDAEVYDSPKRSSRLPKSSVKQSSVQSKHEQQKHVSVPPGRGQSKTQKRNERRRINKKIKHLQNIGVLSSTATVQDYNSWVEARENAHSSQKSPLRTEARVQATDATKAFEKKRNALLESVRSGGVDIYGSGTDGKGSSDKDSIEKSSPHISRVNHAEANVSPLGTEQVAPLHNESSSNGERLAPPQAQTQVLSSLLANEAPHTTSSTPNMVLHKVLSTASEPPKRRAKLDLSSSRRLLFGSLGLRAPKNKEDETKLREKMMENIRLSPKVKASEEAHSNGGLAVVVNDTDDSWKDTIVLRAVECCYARVELSTPPFPFVQRWDPQQQGGSGGFAPGRGKKRKRSQKNLYHESGDEDQSHGMVGGEANLDTLSESRENVDEDMGVMKGSAQPSEVDELQNAVDEQLMRDTNRQIIDPISSNNDVPLSPMDPSSLDRLTEETALPGATIAFQQLEMSQETNWQPRVSEYHTAVITNLLDSGSLELFLTQRRWPVKEKLYDTKTGERLYSKFEMPDYESDEHDEHDDMVEMGFADMIEPRLVKAVGSQRNLQEDLWLTKRGIETIDMSAMPDADEGLQALPDIERTSIIDTSASPGNTNAPVLPLVSASADLPYHVREDQKLLDVHEMTEESRQEISLIIKDAGFRSNVHSDLERGIENHQEEVTLNVELDVKLGTPEVQSPKFNGFSSSPPAEESSKQAPSDHDDSAPTVTNDTTLSNIVSIDDSQSQEAQERTDLAIDDVISEEWNPPQINDDSIAYPVLPNQLDGSKSDSPLIEEPSSPASTKITHRTRQSTRNGGSTTQKKSIFSLRYGTDSDDELPTVESVLSTAPPRLENRYTTEADNDNGDASAQKLATRFTSYSQISTKERPKRQVPSFSVADILITSSASSVTGDDIEYSDPFLPTTSSTQPPPDSQVVDLTFSSDPVDPDESEYEERNVLKGMPKGPGWVKKKTRSAGKQGEGKRLGERKTRSM
ncbi:hypothetical protein MMC17_002239 [Xylographa soralifera]|nr:hypothetical protein [Xylographa soralifera]